MTAAERFFESLFSFQDIALAIAGVLTTIGSIFGIAELEQSETLVQESYESASAAARVLGVQEGDTAAGKQDDRVEYSTASAAAGFVPVERVIDGDTIVVQRDSSGEIAGTTADIVTETIRIIGIDTPETKDPRKPVECFGREATARTEALVAGMRVRLIADPTQDTRDRYGRLVRYVELLDGRDLGAVLLRGGYAQEYTYRDAYQRQEAYRAAEAEAQDAGRGLWASDAC